MFVLCSRVSTHLDIDYLAKVLLYLIRRCYGVIYRLLSSSEPVSEELMPIVTVLILFRPVHELTQVTL